MKITLHDQTVFASNGSIDWQQRPPDRPALVFLHGAAMDHTIWTLPVRRFARKGYRVVALDLPGHGRSAGPALTRIEDLSSWLVEVLDKLETSSAMLVGHSMGSLIAFDFALKNPARCEKLALLGTSLPMPVGEQLLAAAKNNDPLAIEMSNIWSHSRTGRIGGGGVPGEWPLGLGKRLMQRAGVDLLYTDLAACNDYGALEDLPGVAAEKVELLPMPCLLVLGEQDLMTPSHRGQRVKDYFLEAKSVTIPNCGHAMLSEQPNAVLDALSEHMDQVLSR